MQQRRGEEKGDGEKLDVEEIDATKIVRNGTKIECGNEWRMCTSHLGHDCAGK